METPSVDVLIPAYDEARHIGDCLDAVSAQDYPATALRIVVVDAGSTDDTARIVRERAAADPRIELVSAPRRLRTPAALNLGLEHCRADLVARVDGHGFPAPDFVSQAVRVHHEEGRAVACVGGRARPVSETPFGRALALAWTSRFGVGGSVYARPAGRADVATVPWGTYRRAALAEVGGFDPQMNHGEDEDVNWRLRRAGYRVVFDSAIRFDYVNRGSWIAAFRQYRNYGEARVRVAAAHPGFLRAYHLAPAALVGSALALGALAPFSRRARALAAAGAAAYAAGAGVAATAACPPGERRQAWRVALAFVALHAGYGVGLLRGLARRLTG